MYIGDIIKEFRTTHTMTIESFAVAARLTCEEIEVLESNHDKDGSVVPVSMRQLNGIATAMGVPIPILMQQIPKEQELVVHVVAESDQPHAK